MDYTSPQAREATRGPKSYCPVALIEIIWRVFEKLIKPKLMDHAEENRLFGGR